MEFLLTVSSVSALTTSGTVTDVMTVSPTTGEITCETGEATSDQNHETLLGDLGLDDETAETIGDQDDVARRYSNPDVDNDGSVDCGSSSKKFQLDFHVRFNMFEGSQNATISDLIGDFLSSTTTDSEYESTGIYVSYPTTFSTVETGSVTFVDSAVVTQEGGNVAAGTATSAVTTNNFTGYKGFGPNLTNASELPDGEIRFSVGSQTLTFSDVATPSLAKLNAPTGRIFPFIRFNLDTAGCTTSCTLSGVSYQWMKKTETAWTLASLEELELLVKADSGTISIKVDGDEAKTIGITIPETALEGTIAWEATSANLSGVSTSEFDSLITTQICGLGLSTDDKLGLRYFQNINDAAGTCS